MTAGLAGAGDNSLVDLLDRLISGGVVVTGDVVLSVADVDLVQVRLLAVLSSVSNLQHAGQEALD